MWTNISYKIQDKLEHKTEKQPATGQLMSFAEQSHAHIGRKAQGEAEQSQSEHIRSLNRNKQQLDSWPLLQYDSALLKRAECSRMTLYRAVCNQFLRVRRRPRTQIYWMSKDFTARHNLDSKDFGILLSEKSALSKFCIQSPSGRLVSWLFARETLSRFFRDATEEGRACKHDRHQIQEFISSFLIPGNESSSHTARFSVG